MSRLNELIAELCPDGVEYKKLDSICNITKGIQFNKSEMKEAGSFPVINGGINPSGFIEKYNQRGSTITISQGGASAGYVNWQETDFWAGAHCYVLQPLNIVLNRYLYHFVKYKEKQLQQCQYGAGIPALAKTTVSSLQIPVPPLPVQQEIVHILDHFTELTSEFTAELTAELTAQKKQYEYYLEKLLFDQKNRCPLSECCETIADGDHQPPPKADSGIPFITIGNINNNRIDFSNSKYVPISYYEKLQDKRKARCGDILYSVVGSFGIPVHIDDDKPFVFQRHIAILRPNHKVVNSKYLYYCMKSPSFYAQADAVATGAAQRTVGLAALGRLVVPIASIEEQERIVSILDRFDTLCNDLTSGLPAEIAARQKQYEYYRDKLLTFKELKKS